MAQKITLVDDLDGSSIEDGKGGTVRFAVDSNSYEVDLGQKNIDALNAALAPFVDVARKVSARATVAAPAAASKKSDPKALAAIRSWANANGHPTSDRGRIPQSVQDAYYAAN